MELGEDLNHLNTPKQITLKIPKYPPPPPPTEMATIPL